MSVPAFATSIERRALRQAALQAGAAEASLVETPMAAAIGLGMPVHDPVASAVVCLGAGSSEAAIISLGGIVNGGSLRVGGNDLDAAIADALRQQFGVVVAPATLAEIKVELASARHGGPERSLVVPARTVERGDPVSVEVSNDLVEQSVSELIASMVRTVQETLSEAPPDLAQDVLTHGLCLVGGHSRLRGLAGLLERDTGVLVRVAEDPELVVITGLLRCIQEMSSLHAMFRDAHR